MRKRVTAAAAIASLAAAATLVTDDAATAALAEMPGDLLEVEAEDDGRLGFEVEIRTVDGVVEVHVDRDGNVAGIDPGDAGPGDESKSTG